MPSECPSIILPDCDSEIHGRVLPEKLKKSGKPRNLWNPKVHCCTCKRLPLVPLPSQMNSVHTTHIHHICLKAILILFYLFCLGTPNSIFPWSFPSKTLYAFCLTTMRAIYPAHLIFLDLISRGVWIMQVLFCSFLQCVVTSCLSGPSFFLSLCERSNVTGL